MNKTEYLLTKITSGRWIITVVAAIVLAVQSIRGIFDPKDVITIISMIVVFYFTNKQNGNGSKTTGATSEGIRRGPGSPPSNGTEDL